MGWGGKGGGLFFLIVVVAIPALPIVEHSVDFLQSSVELALYVQIHGHETLFGTEVHPLHRFMWGVGVIDDPIIVGAGAMKVEDVLEQEGNCYGEPFGVGVYESTKLRGVHFGRHEMHLCLYLKVGYVSA